MADGVTPPGADSFRFDDRFEVSADLDDDGVSDLVAVDDTGDVVVLLADGPSFEAGICDALSEIVESLERAVSRVDVANFDGDVNPDIAVLDDRSVRVLLNRIDSSDPFVPDVARPTGTDPLSTVAADFDQDGVPDRAVGVASGSGSVEVLYGGASAVTTSSVQVTPDLLISGDFNVDDRLDLMALSVATCGTGGATTSNARAILRDASNTRSFQSLPAFCIAMGEPSAVTVANFDRQVGDDLAVVQADRDEVVVLSSRLVSGNVEFDEVARLSTATSPSAVSAGDFDLDGKIDLAVAGRDGDRGVVQLFLGDGDGTFTLVGTSRDPCMDGIAGGCGLDHLPGPMTLAFLDADAAPDIVVAADSSTCVGDCNGDGCVSQSEVERINGFVGGPPASDCSDADANRDGVVTLDENTQAENNRQSQSRPTPSGPNDCDDTKACPHFFTKLTFLLSDNAPSTPTPTRTATGTQTATRTISGTPTNTGTPTITATRTGTASPSRTATPIPTKTCEAAFCVQGDSCAIVPEGGNRGGLGLLFVAGFLAFLRAAFRRRH